MSGTDGAAALGIHHGLVISYIIITGRHFQRSRVVAAGVPEVVSAVAELTVTLPGYSSFRCASILSVATPLEKPRYAGTFHGVLIYR